MEILPIAASSLNAAATVTAVRAENIVNATTPNYTASEPVYSSQANGGVAVFSQDIGQPVNEMALPHRKITHFLRENYFLLLAFAFPYIFVFSVPLLGFFCVGFAHGAAAYTLAIVAQ